MANQTAFDFSDIQGIVRFGHGRLKAACMLLLNIKDPPAARLWLRHTAFTSGATSNPPPDKALQIAFTAPGLARLGLERAVLEQFSGEFLAGMYEPSRSRHLGDTDANSPENWRWGGNANALPDLVLMLYALPGMLETFHQELETSLFNDAFSAQDHLSTNHVVTTEPFGFADGISQPKIDWLRDQTADLHRRDTYSNLLALGEVVLCYPNEYGEYTARPLLSPDTRSAMLPKAEDKPELKDLGRNGTYLVLRQLEQDAAGADAAQVCAVAGGLGEVTQHLAGAGAAAERAELLVEPVAHLLADVVRARGERVALEQRRIAAAVGVGDVAAERLAPPGVAAVQLDHDAGRGPAVRGVQHVRGQSSHGAIVTSPRAAVTPTGAVRPAIMPACRPSCSTVARSRSPMPTRPNRCCAG